MSSHTCLQAFVDSGGTEQEKLHSFIVLLALLLQKPMDKCSCKEAGQHLRRRMDMWEKKELRALFEEGMCLQKQQFSKPLSRKPRGEDDSARKFGISMSNRRVHLALRMLTENPTGGVLQLDDVITFNDESTATVEVLLKKKAPRPAGNPANESVLLDGDCSQVNNIRSALKSLRLIQCKRSRGSANDQPVPRVLTRTYGEGCDHPLKVHHRVGARRWQVLLVCWQHRHWKQNTWRPFRRVVRWHWTSNEEY